MFPVYPLTPQHFLWLLGSVCQVHRIPFDPGLSMQQCPPPLSTETLLNAFSRLPLKVGFRRPLPGEWQQSPMPCVAFLKPQPAQPEQAAQPDAPQAGAEAPDAAATPAAQDLSAAAPATQDLSPATPAAPAASAAPEGQGSAPESPAEAQPGEAQAQPVRPGCACAGAAPDEPSMEPEPKPEFVEEPRHPVMLIQSDGQRILFFRAGSETPETITVAEFAERFEPDVLFLVKEGGPDSGGPDPDAAQGPQRFGLRWFIPEFMRYKKTWRDVLLGSLALQLVSLTTPLCTQVIIDKVVAHQTYSTLYMVGAALVIFALFSALMTWLRQYMVIHTGNRINAVLGSRVFHHLLHLPMPYFENRATGVLVARLRGVEQIRDFLAGAAFSAMLDFPFLIIALAVMLAYSWQLTLISLGIILLIAVMSLLVTPIFRHRLDKQFLTGARAQSFLTEYISGMNTVKSLQMEPQLDRQYGDIFSAYLSSTFATRQVSNTYNTIANTLEQIMTLSILIVGALLVMKNDGFSIGMLVAFQMFASRMSQPMLRMVGLWQEFQQTQVSIARLADIMDMPQEPHTLSPLREGRTAGRIEFKNVSFRYSEMHPFIFRGLNLVLEPGKLTVIMGRSGCGKSTLAKLMQAFYMPTEGQIMLDGKDLRRMAANELRRNYGVVPQETLLFSGTIYDNLIAAHPHADFRQVMEACKLAEIHDDIEGLPEGYQTSLGEHGVGLSGGQRQRLAIARALLKRPSILIFDEATSNLDAETAEHFARTVNRLKGRTTMLFIAHNLPRSLQVDEVVRFGPVPGANTGLSVAGRPMPPRAGSEGA